MKTWSTPVRAERSNLIPCISCGALNFKPLFTYKTAFSYSRCKICRLVQINPQPINEDVIARYSSVSGNEYLSYEIENEKTFLKLQLLALQDAGFDKYEKTLLARVGEPSPSVLDVGCATGSLLVNLRERGWRVTGVEVSPCAEYAKEKYSLDVRTKPLEDINFFTDSFDAILASHLIEHLNNPRFFLSEARKILKKDGRLFITTPNISGFQARLFGKYWRSAIFDHLYLFSKRTLTELLEKTGFKVESISTWGGLAAGFAPSFIKKPVDYFAKKFGFGDVMILRAKKTDCNN